MPDPESFRHQDYRRTPAQHSYEILVPSSLDLPGTSEFAATIDEASRRLIRAGVNRIILVHGTLVGTDALGWFGHWQRLAPSLSSRLKETYKGLVDQLSGDRGNYTQAYAELMERSLNRVIESNVTVQRFEWSSENHHLGRADAAVRLANELLDYEEAGEKVLLWGHSHAGNVFALVSNLLGSKVKGEPCRLRRFFDASRHFWSTTKRIELRTWKLLERRLARRSEPQTGAIKYDMVTFGTPIRYGWDKSGVGKLLHFVNHRAISGAEPFRCAWPANTPEFLKAIKGETGDFLQQSFIARSDFPPAIWSWNAWKGNRILRNLLESSELSNGRLERLKQGVRVADTGTTLLADYGHVDESAQEICGHAVYTDQNWMAFHLQEVTARFYGKSENAL